MLRALAGCAAVTNPFGYAFLAVYVLQMVEDLGLGSAMIGFVFATGGVGAFLGAMLARPLARRVGTGWTLILAQSGGGGTAPRRRKWSGCWRRPAIPGGAAFAAAWNEGRMPLADLIANLIDPVEKAIPRTTTNGQTLREAEVLGLLV